MRNILTILASMVYACVVMAGDNPDSLPLVINTTGTGPTNTTTSTVQVDGRVAAIDFTLSGTTGTNHVTITAGNQTLFNLTNLISSATYYPVVPTCSTVGAPYGLATNNYVSALLVREKVTITAHGDGDATTNTITALIKLEK